MLSSIGKIKTVQKVIKSKEGDRVVQKPSYMHDYNQFMGGVDKFDQLCASYCFNRRNKKWYHVLWHFIIEVALVNARIVYNIQNKMMMSQVCFRQNVIEGLLQGYSLKKRRSSLSGNISVSTRLTGRHFIGKYENKASRPNWSVCSILPSHCAKKGKGTCKRA